MASRSGHRVSDGKCNDDQKIKETGTVGTSYHVFFNSENKSLFPSRNSEKIIIIINFMFL